MSVPPVLLIQVPRYGKERIFDMVWPDPTLDITPFLPAGSSAASPMRLRCVLSIGLSHFVAFFCDRAQRSWFFFDSMADRIGDECVPRLQEAPEIARLLARPEGPFRPAPPKPRTMEYRLLSDCYLCVYLPDDAASK